MKKNSTKETLDAMPMMELMLNVIETTENNEMRMSTEALPYVRALSIRLGLTDIQTMLLAAFVNSSDERHIEYHDLASFFCVRTIKIMTLLSDLKVLQKKGFIVIRRAEGGNHCEYFRLAENTIECLQFETLPTPRKTTDLTPRHFMDYIFSLLEKLKEHECCRDEFFESLEEVINDNQQLEMARSLKKYNFNGYDLLILLVLTKNFAKDNDDRQNRHDLSPYLPEDDLYEQVYYLEKGTTPLMEQNLVEYAIVDGQASPEYWKLTKKAKYDLYAEMKFKAPRSASEDLLKYDSITPKKLLYNKDVAPQVDRLENLLDRDRMKNIMAELKKAGMRSGFTCLFYGSPGTGKTETALQLARLTKRDIFLVDIPSIRSKWVGETEQNIKDIFDTYRSMTKECDNAPILLFNEADALLGRRKEGGGSSVDKMENAMQNIILQEMESLEGIMIATTNLTCNLDDAFERRFLFKIEFQKPDKEVKAQLWRTMLGNGISEEDALCLASRYDFSGGQIENIARKRTIEAILSGKKVPFEKLDSFCQNELLDKKKAYKPIGF